MIQQQNLMYNSLQNGRNKSKSCRNITLCFFLACTLIGSIYCFIRCQQIPYQINNIQSAYSCSQFCDEYIYNIRYQCCKDYRGNFCVNKEGCRYTKINQLNADIITFRGFTGMLSVLSFGFLICLCCTNRAKRNRAPQVAHAQVNQEQMHLQINISQQSRGAKKRKIEQNYESFAVESEDTCCAVCMMEFTGEKAIILKCGHIFHSKCIRDWAVKQENCPVCRASH